MIQRIRIDLETIESMLYFWQATKDREKVNERFIHDVTQMEAYRLVYDEEFTEESVRKVLSAVTNREPFQGKNRKEGRFYSNNLWMMEDLGYTQTMVQPVKTLNLDALKDKLNAQGVRDVEEIVVHFVPLHLDPFYAHGNHLILNFFRVRPSDFDDSTSFEGQELTQFIEAQIKAMLA
ncbi:MAG: hypothetical protein ACM3ZQ_04965 [Bacillota bacterium]